MNAPAINGESQSCGEVNPCIVARTNLLTTVDSLLERVDVILLEGEDGIGKSMLARQLEAQYQGRVITAFFHPSSRWGYAPANLQDELAEQMCVILGHSLPSETDGVTEQEYQNLVWQLQRRSRRIKKQIILIIDGIDELLPNDTGTRESLLNILPLGLPGFSTIISWNANIEYAACIGNAHCATKPFVIPAFSDNEAELMFDGLAIQKNQLMEINRLCRGIPGRLISVRRLLFDNERVDELLAKLELHAPNLFELEWKQTVGADETTMLALAVFAYETSGFPLEHAARLLRLEPDELLKNVSRFRFIQANGEQVSYVSESFRRFVQSKLIADTKRVLGLRIEDLLLRPEDAETLQSLPLLLNESQRYEQLLEYLSPEYYARAIGQRQSLSFLKKTNSIGLAAATAENRDILVVQFTLLHNILEELCTLDLWRAEIYARSSLGDFDTALIVANTSRLVEDRLCLLSLVAKLKKNSGALVEPELIEGIKHAFSLTDIDFADDRMLQVAADVVSVIPEISIAITKNLRKTKAPLEADIAIASILMQSDIVESFDRSDKVNEIGELKSQISSPQIRLMAEVLPAIFGRTNDAKAVLHEANKIQSFELKLPLLQNWILRNRESAAASEVAYSTIQQMLSETAYTPTARDVRKVLRGLPRCKDDLARRRLVQIIEPILAALERRGPTIDYVNLMLLLLETAIQFESVEIAKQQASMLRDYVSSQSNQLTRSECTAAFWAFLMKPSCDKLTAEDCTLAPNLLASLQLDFQSLLREAAAHFIVARPIIKTIARGSLTVAYGFVEQLNTRACRDQAYASICLSAAEASHGPLDLDLLRAVLDRIHDVRVKSRAVAETVKLLETRPEACSDAPEKILQFLQLLECIESATVRCVGFASMRMLLDHQEFVTLSEKQSHVESRLFEAWESIDRSWEKIRTGFEICAALGTQMPILARRFVDMSERLRNETELLSPETAWLSISGIRLATASLAGLMEKELYSDEDFIRLQQVISHIPSCGEQAFAWADVAQRLLIAGRAQKAREIVNRFVIPQLALIPVGDSGFRNFVYSTAAQVFWGINAITAGEYIEKLPSEIKDVSYQNICQFLLRKDPLFEPYLSAGKTGAKTDFDTLIQVISLVRHIENDSIISGLIEEVVDAVELKANRFTSEQVSDVVRRIQEIIASQLPAKHGISHDGYVYYSFCNVFRLSRASRPEWEKLVNDARAIPNRADRALVLTKISSHLPSSMFEQRETLLRDVENDVLLLPATYDRIQRLQAIAAVYERFNKVKCKELLRAAMELTSRSDSDSVISLRRNLVDAAHRVDSETAQELIAILDDDPARISARQELKHEIAVLDASRNLRRTTAGTDGKKKSLQRSGFRDDPLTATLAVPNEKNLPTIAWRALGELNAGRNIAFPIRELREHIRVASSMPLSTSFPIMNWVISCASRLYSGTNQATSILRPLFESTLASCFLSQGIISHCANRTVDPRRYSFQGVDPQSSTLIHAGDRDQGLSYVRDWILNTVDEYIIVCEPYWDLDDLQLLRFVLEAGREVSVRIVTDLARFEKEPGIAEKFNSHWRAICSLSPPDTDVYMLKTVQSNRFPIHDRWLLTKNGGLRIGSSLNGIGKQRLSDISTLSREEAFERELEVLGFVNREVRVHQGERIEFSSFSLR